MMLFIPLYRHRRQVELQRSVQVLFGQNGTFSYIVAVAGQYNYKCGVHSSMVGSFSTSTTTPVTKPTLTLNALYPNPSIDYVHIESAQTIKTVDVYSEAGVLIETRSFS